VRAAEGRECGFERFKALFPFLNDSSCQKVLPLVTNFKGNPFPELSGAPNSVSTILWSDYLVWQEVTNFKGNPFPELRGAPNPVSTILWSDYLVWQTWG